MCNDNPHQEIKVEILESSTQGSHKVKGSCSFTLGELIEAFSYNELVKAPEYSVRFLTGFFNLKNIIVEKKNSFLEYVFGGCNIDLTIAIDFTLSNGNPKSCESLHYFWLECKLIPTSYKFCCENLVVL